jgi:uncharacterized protein (DUF305 family)
VAVCALLVTAGLVGCTAEEPETPTNTAPVIVPGKPGEEASTIPPGEATPVEQEQPNEADVRFLSDMVVHHGQALEMAELVPDRASREDVIGIASRINDTQGPEIDMMNRFLEQAGKPKVDPKATDAHQGMPGMATPEQLEALRDADGAVFESLFLQMMIAHHEGALVMVEEVGKNGVNVRVQEIAEDVGITQLDEIERMRGMLG